MIMNLDGSCCEYPLSASCRERRDVHAEPAMSPKLTPRWPGFLAAGVVTAMITLAGCASAAPAGSSSGPSASSAPASSGASGAAGASQQVTITGNSSLRFAPMTVHVRTGTVKITLKDMGSYPHNIVIPGLGVTSATVTGAPGSGSVSFTVTFKHPGHYAFHCQYHQSAGMA